SDPDARLYRTGDIGRWRLDGTLDLLGRTDDQVKVRGHRIELGEIETALRQHPSVRHAAATTVEKSPGDQRLIAYIVGDPTTGAPGHSELQSWLRGRLPEYMMPNSFNVI